MLRTRFVSSMLGLCALCLPPLADAQEVAAPLPPAEPSTAPAPVTTAPCAPDVPQAQPALPVPVSFSVLFESRPLGAKVLLDGKRLCETPCRVPVEAGVHHVSMTLEHHIEKHERLTLGEHSTVDFALEKQPYNFFLMNDLKEYGSVLTTGVSPSDSKYRFITVFDGAHFAGLSTAVDPGVAGGVFSYHRSARGSSWSIFGFGPSLRVGRLIATSHIELLSFRHEAPASVRKGWRPGLTTRLQLPLLNAREAKGWAALIPVPTAGIDVWVDRQLSRDETALWLGLAWLSGTDF